MAKHFKQSTIKTRRIIYIVLITLIIIATLYIIFSIKSKNDTIKESNALNNVQIDISNVDEKTTERMLQVQELKKENSDVIGWIEIEGTNINYPVLQGEDNSYYMTHNYKKEEVRDGSIFLDKDYDWSIPSSNLLMYGHNMGDGAMFQDLLKYEYEEFYNQHPTIRFTTTTEDAEYEIISAFKSRVYYKSEKNVFRYYYFINAYNEEEYNEFVNNAKEASFYDTGKTAEYGDQLMTLSTCSYHTEDGRFAVVARKK